MNGQSHLSFILVLAVSFSALGGCSGPQTGLNVIDEDAPKEFTATDSGLKYRILRKSDGPKPKSTDTVVVDYHGTLDNGQVFDSSYGRREPTQFGLNAVIPGWTEGLQLVGKGGMIELEIPSELAYGERRQPGIPPNSTLHFKVELHDIK